MAEYQLIFDNPWLDTVNQSQTIVVTAKSESSAVKKIQKIAPHMKVWHCKKTDGLNLYRIRYRYKSEGDSKPSKRVCFSHATSAIVAKLRFHDTYCSAVIDEIKLVISYDNND